MATIVPLEPNAGKPKRLLDQRVKASLTRRGSLRLRMHYVYVLRVVGRSRSTADEFSLARHSFTAPQDERGYGIEVTRHVKEVNDE
jgi:hypothetical protein